MDRQKYINELYGNTEHLSNIELIVYYWKQKKRFSDSVFEDLMTELHYVISDDYGLHFNYPFLTHWYFPREEGDKDFDVYDFRINDHLYFDFEEIEEYIDFLEQATQIQRKDKLKKIENNIKKKNGKN